MGLLNSLKPGASIGTHLFTAALMWSIIGIYLMIRGVLLHGPERMVLLGALVVGTIKSLFLLDRSARKNIARILDFADGTCLGGVYSWKMWAMVACMMIGGRLLRHSLVPAFWVGALYTAVGWALFLSSRLLWQRWRAATAGKSGADN